MPDYTCLPFGTGHGSQIFQCLSDTAHHVMRQRSFCVIDYIDDYVEVGVPDIVHASFASLFKLMIDLGLTISDSKLVPPSTQVVCLGVLIDTENCTRQIESDKRHSASMDAESYMHKTPVTVTFGTFTASQGIFEQNAGSS